MKENKSRCDHKLKENALFGDRDLIELIPNNKGYYEWEAKNGNAQPVKLQFCTKCGQILVKF